MQHNDRAKKMAPTALVCNLNQCWDPSATWIAQTYEASPKPSPTPVQIPTSQSLDWQPFPGRKDSTSWNYGCAVMSGAKVMPPNYYNLVSHGAKASWPLVRNQDVDLASYLLSILPSDFVDSTPATRENTQVFDQLINEAGELEMAAMQEVLEFLHAKYTIGIEICWPLTEWQAYLSGYKTLVEGVKMFFVDPSSLQSRKSAMGLWGTMHLGQVQRKRPTCLEPTSAFRGEVSNVLLWLDYQLDTAKSSLSEQQQAEYLSQALYNYSHPFLRAVGAAAQQLWGCNTRLPCVGSLVYNRATRPRDLKHFRTMLMDIIHHNLAACIVFGNMAAPPWHLAINGGSA
ncbi:hypothetical protein CDD81_6448 [Ophiocordyceps australis]|uniref:Uncharacterized protein n=1 Tax=Ophiocordyceps australis TaxID=1399860 RepID=A0A2C5YI73_9HYPO|nr:hypothetical protein CDD81_6448 [Ophiocordyceps australis]